MQVTFVLPPPAVECYDFVEIIVRTEALSVGNPYRDAALSGVFTSEAGTRTVVDGFCDSPDGSLFRLRFMPTQPGRHDYDVTLACNGKAFSASGTLEARDAGRRGLLRVDPDYPFHFTWAGTGEHYFYNSTTAYALMGFRDEQVIRRAIDRLHRLKVNRIRVALNPPRVASGMAWFEPVYPSEAFTFLFGPWAAENIENLEDPGWDVTRFDVAYWQKFERMLAYARSLDMQVSVIFYVDGRRPGVYPFGASDAPGEDERRYYRYAAARLAAFSNVMWDVTNEWELFRPRAWADAMGQHLKACDPYGHLTSIHGHPTFQFRTSPWADFAMYQCWDEHGGYAFMLRNRAEQLALGRPMPQVNEEYGYEDHYPQAWGEGRVAPARSADNRRRLAWEMVMAGGYQTTGEYAGNGLGGWINGLGDDSMTMLVGYGHLADFFRSFEWWKLEPHPELAGEGALCLAEPGRQYVLYTPGGRASVSLKLEAGNYVANWFNPRTGERGPSQPAPHAGTEIVFRVPDPSGDLALRLVARSS